MLSSSEASHAEAYQFSTAESSRGRLETAGMGRSATVRSCTLLSKDQAQRERDTKRIGHGSAMEVDQEDQDGEKQTASNNFMSFIGTLSCNQRPLGRDQNGEAGKDNGQSASTGAMDASPLGSTLPTSTVGSPKILGPNLVNPKPPPPPNATPARDAAQADAMATTVEKIYQQKDKEKEQDKAVLMQKNNEMAQAREKQRELDQSKADHQEHLKNMENKVNEIAAKHETQNQRSQRDLELKAQELAAKNAALEEELLLRQQS